MTYSIISNTTDEHKKNGVITVYKPIAGWKSVQYWWNPSGFWEPWETGVCGWPTELEAIVDARMWAEAEKIPLLLSLQQQEQYSEHLRP